MSDQVVLIVEKNDRIRAAIKNALKSRFVRTLDVAHAFDAMSSLGRAEFGAVVVTPGKRQLSLRGLLSLARRRHPGVHLFVIVEPGTPIEQLEQNIGVKGVQPIDPSTTVEQLGGIIVSALQAPYVPEGAAPQPPPAATLPVEDGFDIPMTPVAEAEPSIVVEITPPGATPVPADVAPPAQPAPPIVVDDAPAAPMPAAAAARPPEAPMHIGPAPVPLAMTLPDLPTSTDEGAPVQSEPPPPSGPAPVAEVIAAAEQRSFSVPMPITAVETFEDLSGPSDDHTPVVDAAPPAWSSPAEWSTPGGLPPAAAGPHGIALPQEAEFPLLEGTLDGRAGPALLLSIAAQELTGILHVDQGNAEGRIYLHQGEPVWATPKDGDAGLFALLKEGGKLPAEAEFPQLPDGQLVAHLSAAGLLDGKDLYQFMLGFVRDRVLALIAEEQAHYAFYDDTTFVEVAPLLTVNPFGLVFESKRRSVTPDRLLAIGGEMEWKYLHPLPALAPATERIKPFARGMDISRYVNGTRTMRAFCDHTGLDVVMGTLMILALEEARLVSVEDNARDLEEEGVELSSTTGVHAKRLPTTDDVDPGEESPGSDEFFSLYMKLKPLTNPRQLLGVDENADLGQLQSAYEGLLQKLDPALVPEGSAQALLRENVRQLRSKVTDAYQHLSKQG